MSKPKQTAMGMKRHDSCALSVRGSYLARSSLMGPTTEALYASNPRSTCGGRHSLSRAGRAPRDVRCERKFDPHLLAQRIDARGSPTACA